MVKRTILALALAAGMAAVLAPAAPAAATPITWYHVCMNLDHSKCWQANGNGNQVTVTTSPNKWQALPMGNGNIQWQNGSGNCLRARDGGLPAVVETVAGPCDGRLSEQWSESTQSNGSIVFFSPYSGGDAGTFGTGSGSGVDTNPPAGGFDYGWIPFPQ